MTRIKKNFRVESQLKYPVRKKKSTMNYLNKPVKTYRIKYKKYKS